MPKLTLNESEIVSLIIGVILASSFLSPASIALFSAGVNDTLVESFYIGWRISSADLFALLGVIYLSIKYRLQLKRKEIILLITLLIPVIISWSFSTNITNSIIHTIRLTGYLLFGILIIKNDSNLKYTIKGFLIGVGLIALTLPLSHENFPTRMTGLTGNPAVTGGLLIITGYLILHTIKHKITPTSWLVILTFAGLTLTTGSRTAIIAGVILVVLTITYANRRNVFKLKILIASLTVLSFLGALGFPASINEIKTARNFFISSPSYSNSDHFSSGRLRDIKNVYNQSIVKKFPFGVGFFNTRKITENVPHSIPVLLLTELGILIIPLIVVLGYIIWTSRFLPLLGLITLGITDFYLYQGTWGLFLLSGTFIGIGIAKSAEYMEFNKKQLAVYNGDINTSNRNNSISIQ